MNLQARLYDPVIGRFLSVDPLFEMQVGINAYHYCGNDPVNASDPSGLFLSNKAIEDKEARAEAERNNISTHLTNMNRWDLEAISLRQMVLNGMYHALENYRDLAANGMNLTYTDMFNSLNCWSGGAGGGYITPQQSNERDRSDATRVSPEYKSKILVRPDSDGYITFSEGQNWYANGHGECLYADLSLLDLSRISARDFKGIGDSKYFNLASPLYFANIDDALVYGTIKLTYLGGNQVFCAYDDYDFDMHSWWNIESIPRNIETIIDATIHGPGGNDFRIWFLPNRNGTISN